MKNYSIALFGSLLRKDFDKYSDKDLLIVSDSYKNIKGLKAKYESKGISVTFYTYTKLEFLSFKESLFIEHLKREAHLLFDADNRLANLLLNTPPITSSHDRLAEAKEYFQPFEFIPSSTVGFGWYCDTFYVGFRNYLINLSALKGNYKFSFMDLIEEAYKDKQIDKNEFEMLRQLRVIKRNYRTKHFDELPSTSYMQDLSAFIQRMGFLKKTRTVVDAQIGDIVKPRLMDAGLNYYQKLRLIEIYYYSSKVNIPDIENLICNPNCYAFILKNEKFIKEKAEQIDRYKNGTQQSVPAIRADIASIVFSANPSFGFSG